jgi:hypothetical protein
MFKSVLFQPHTLAGLLWLAGASLGLAQSTTRRTKLRSSAPPMVLGTQGAGIRAHLSRYHLEDLAQRAPGTGGRVGRDPDVAALQSLYVHRSTRVRLGFGAKLRSNTARMSYDNPTHRAVLDAEGLRRWEPTAPRWVRLPAAGGRATGFPQPVDVIQADPAH